MNSSRTLLGTQHNYPTFTDSSAVVEATPEPTFTKSQLDYRRGLFASVLVSLSVLSYVLYSVIHWMASNDLMWVLWWFLGFAAVSVIILLIVDALLGAAFGSGE